MLLSAYNLQATPAQLTAIDEALRVTPFLRNTCLRLWMDARGVGANDLPIACGRLAHACAFVARLTSQARQAAAVRAWAAIRRFYATCQSKRPGKKGDPRFQRACRSVEDQVTGWQLDPDGKHLTVTDGGGIGRLRLVGTPALAPFALEQIQRVRLLRRAEGYSAQFVLQAERRGAQVAHGPTGRVVGLAGGLHVYCMDTDGQAVANPRFIHQIEQQVRRRGRRLSRTSLHHKQDKKSRQHHAARQRAKHNKYPPVTPLGPRPAASSPAAASAPVPTAVTAAWAASQSPPRPRPPRQSANWHKARRVLATTYLTLPRQREDFARKQANALVSSYDLIALEDLQVRNLVKNRRLAKAISDAGWARFRHWVEHYGRVHDIPVVAVPPHYTSQVCSGCGEMVRKSLSVRTHICPRCGLILDRDHNAALLIREAGFAHAIEQGVWDPDPQRVITQLVTRSGTVGHTETSRLGTAALLRAAARRSVAPAGGTKNLPHVCGQSVNAADLRRYQADLRATIWS